MPWPPSFQNTESSSEDILKSLIILSKSLIKSSSQSLKSLENLRFQPPWPRLESHTSLTVAFLWTAKANNWGNFGTRIATPLISPEFNSSPLPHLKLYVIPTPICLLHNLLPNPHSKRPTSFVSPPSFFHYSCETNILV